jgi:hypothetical protein
VIKGLKRKIHFQDITNQIERFEGENMDWLVLEELMGLNLWFIIKKPLFYSFKHTHYRLKRSERKRIKPLPALFRSMGSFAKVFYYALTIRKGDAVIATDINRTENDGGVLVDKFFGPLFKEGIIRKAVYFEHNSSKDPAGIRRHINTAGFNIISGVLWRYYSKKKIFKEKAVLFSERFNSSVPDKNPALMIDSKKVLELITYFYAELVLYKFLWRLLKPKRVFIADGIPRGVMAASRFCNIPVHEFQHGFVSEKKADYIIAGDFKACKNKMVVPNFILVFGQYFKDLLLKPGFWTENEVKVIGSYPLDKARTSCTFQMPEQGEKTYVLWATQPTTFADARKVLEGLLLQKIQDTIFHFKMHPLEPTAQKDWYMDLIDKYPHSFKLIPSNYNFFEALKGKHLLISFHSTVLLEAIALGYPVMSVTTEKFRKGINDLVTTDVSDAIRPVKDAEEIMEVIRKFRSSPSYANQWTERCKAQGNYFFAEDYQQHLQQFFAIN